MNAVYYNQWVVLSKNLNEESEIMGERASPENLQKMVEDGLAFYLMDENEMIIAFYALYQIPEHPEMFEFGSLWVHPKYRKQGNAKLVTKKCVDRITQLHAENQDKKYVAFIISFNGNETVLHLAQNHDFKLTERSEWEKDVPWAVSCGVCDKYDTDEERRNCSEKAQKCKMLVRTWNANS